MIFPLFFRSVRCSANVVKNWGQRAHPTEKMGTLVTYLGSFPSYCHYRSQICGDMGPYNQNNRCIPGFTVPIVPIFQPRHNTGPISFSFVVVVVTLNIETGLVLQKALQIFIASKKVMWYFVTVVKSCSSCCAISFLSLFVVYNSVIIGSGPFHCAQWSGTLHASDGETPPRCIGRFFCRSFMLLNKCTVEKHLFCQKLCINPSLTNFWNFAQVYHNAKQSYSRVPNSRTYWNRLTPGRNCEICNSRIPVLH